MLHLPARHPYARPHSLALVSQRAIYPDVRLYPEDIATIADWTACAYPDKHYRQAASQIWQEKVRLVQESHGIVQPMEFRIRCKNGSQRIVVINALIYEDRLLIIDDSGPGWSGVEKDETPLNTTKPSGSGIGLYVVRTAMKNHHGTISFGQSPLGGAQVRLRFPKPMEKPSPYTPAPATHAHPNPL